MPDDRYNVVFSGELSTEATQESVRSHLQGWFRLDDAQLENLFSGRRVVVKRDVSLDVASRYQAAFRKAGGLALIEISGSEAADTAAAGGEEQAQPEALTKPATDATALALAPVGTPLEEIDDRGPLQSPDTSALSLVPGLEWSLEDCDPLLPPPPTFDIDELELIPMSDPLPKQAD
jgi:hypothetical protein